MIPVIEGQFANAPRSSFLGNQLPMIFSVIFFEGGGLAGKKTHLPPPRPRRSIAFMRGRDLRKQRFVEGGFFLASFASQKSLHDVPLLGRIFFFSSSPLRLYARA